MVKRRKAKAQRNAKASARRKVKKTSAKRSERAKVSIDRSAVRVSAKGRYLGIPMRLGQGEDLQSAARRALGTEKRKPSAIKVGKRHRKEMGDLVSLARSIDARGGLLHPIVIDPKNRLIAGERRLRAWSLSKFAGQPIPVTVVDIDSIVAGENDENAQRKDFTPSEAVAIAAALAPREKAAARERQRAHGAARGKKSKVENKGRASDRIERATGMSRKTLERASAVVAAAKEDPKRFGKLKEAMDKSGSVNGPFKRLQVMQQSTALRKEPPALPGKGPYRAGLIDPPWSADENDPQPEATGRAYFPYPTMSTEQIAAIDVASILHRDAVVGLWITNFHLVRGHHLPLLKAWGLDAVTIRTWVKDRMGTGKVLRGQTEHLIIATRGKPTIDCATISTFFHAAVGKHSEKPQKAYDDFERLVPASSYFELFSRREMPANWHGHGDQVGAIKKPAPRKAAA